MCGICGYISKKKICKNDFEKMNNSMYHRGPDDAGIYQTTVGDNELGLGHRRLAILDLSSKGRQPMFDEKGKCGIVFNGEIYNYSEIRRKLEEKGYIFFSECDTEVVLKAYLEYGKNFLKYLNGMFAIAIYDFENRMLLLARDRIGKKPLYYYQDKDIFLFASELKPIMLCPYFKKNIRTEIIARYLARSTIIPPDTIFSDTYKLGQGEYLIYKNGIVNKNKYWSILDAWNIGKHNQIMEYNYCKGQLKQLLYDAVDKRLISDVPVGTFLSGGCDSTLVTAVAHEIKRGGIDTFSIGFDDEQFDEAVYAKETADYLGTHHHEMIMSEKHMLNMIKDMPLYYDEPFADSSQLPSMLVSEFARKNITVALSGDGGDELFCGYLAYDELNMLQKAEPYLNLLRSCTSRKIIGTIVKNDKIRSVINNRDSRYKTQILAGMREELALSLLQDQQISAKYDVESLITAKDWKEKAMLVDMMTYLPDEILTKMDRASMRYSLEMRCPILDYRILEFSFQIPMQYKYYKNEKKYILKDILYDFVPREMMERKKQGFAAPVNKWLRTELKGQLLRFSDADILNRQGIFVADNIKRLIAMGGKSDRYLYQSVLWGFFVFQMWYQMYIEDLWN